MRTLLFVVALFVSSVVQAADPGKLTAENFNKIKIGSTLQAVYAVLGREDTSTFETERLKSLVWRAGDKKIHVDFTHDKVTLKSQIGL